MAAVFRNPDNTAHESLLDRAGILVSSICLVQCIALTVVILAAPVVSLGFFGSDWFHRMLLLLILPISLAAFVWGYRAHRHAGPVLAGALGVMLLLLAATLEYIGLHPLAASLLTSAGGLVLIAAHWRNLRCRRGRCPHPDSRPVAGVGSAPDY